MASSRARRARYPQAPLYLTPAAALYGLFVLWPLLQVLWLSLQRWNGYGPQTFAGLANFGALGSDPLFRTALGHSLLWEVGAMALTTLLGLAIALLVARLRARVVFLTVLFFPALLPATVVASVWVLVYSPLTGLLNTLLRNLGLTGLALDWLGDPHLTLGALFVAWLWSSVGVSVLLFWTGMHAISDEWFELALMEGAGPFWRFRHVTLPGLRRVAVVVLLINAALGAQIFDLVFVTTGGGPGYATMLLPLDVYGRAFGGRAGQGAAAACIQVAMGVLLTALTLLLLRSGDETLDTGSPARSPRDGGRQPSMVMVPAVLVLLIVLAPLGWLAVASLEPGRAFALGAGLPGPDPRTWAWGNFGTVWESGMSGAIATSLLLAAGVTALTLLLASPAAFALVRLAHARRQAVAAAALLVGLLQPTSVLIIPLFSLLGDLHLLDSLPGIVLPEAGRALPFAVFILWGFLAQSPTDLLEAAAVDGATPWQQMTRIALPLARPALFAAGIWAFVTSWNEYLVPTLVSQDGSIQTVPTLLATFIGRYDTQFGLLAAGTMMATLPSLGIYLALRRPAAGGLTRAERSVQ